MSERDELMNALVERHAKAVERYLRFEEPHVVTPVTAEELRLLGYVDTPDLTLMGDAIHVVASLEKETDT